MSESFDALVTLRFRIKNIGLSSDLDPTLTFEECVRDLLVSEGILGVCEDDYEVVAIEAVPATAGGAGGGAK